MSRHSNHVIPKAWAVGQSAYSHTGNFWTDGTKLYSYRLCIRDTVNGDKVLYEYRSGTEYGYQSQTTSCHVGKAAQSADLIDCGKRIRKARG